MGRLKAGCRGLIRDGITEVIATTRGNAAPMGVICRDRQVRMVLFSGSHTAANIRRDGWVVANIVTDPLLYVRTAFGDLHVSEFVEDTAADICINRLADPAAWIAFRALSCHDLDDRTAVTLTPIRAEIIHRTVPVVNRGFSSLIEATVHATRYIRDRDPVLAGFIRHHAVIIRKCGGPREQEALDLLYRSIGWEL